MTETDRNERDVRVVLRNALDLDDEWLIIAISDEGDEAVDVWLMPRRADADQSIPGPENGPLWPDHERVGPLPAYMQRRVDVNRCHAPKADGRSCRAYVANPDDRCRHHNEEDR